MKIGQPTEISVSVTSQNAAAQKASQGSAASESAKTDAKQSTRSAGVAVTVSALARDLEKTESNSSADIDTQKVAAIRSAIQEGTYTVNPEAIADKLLSNAQEMLHRTMG